MKTLKILLEYILFHTGKLWSLIYSYKLNQNVEYIRNVCYSGWLSKEFKSLGKRTILNSMNLVGGKFISLGNDCTIGEHAVLTAWERHGKCKFNPIINIGNNVSIGSECHITAINRIEIGNNVLTGKKVTITDNSHGNTDLESLCIFPSKRQLYSTGPVIIENGVWIGDKVSILPNVRIGKNSIIGANAVVTSNIPENCIAAGVPAKVIKHIIK